MSNISLWKILFTSKLSLYPLLAPFLLSGIPVHSSSTRFLLQKQTHSHIPGSYMVTVYNPTYGHLTSCQQMIVWHQRHHRGNPVPVNKDTIIKHLQICRSGYSINLNFGRIYGDTEVLLDTLSILYTLTWQANEKMKASSIVLE